MANIILNSYSEFLEYQKNNGITLDNSLCATGRRPKDLCGYNWDNYASFQQTFVDFLDSLYEKGIRNFISGGAQGFDQMTFWAVNALKSKHSDIKNIVFVPFDGQANAWKGNNAFSGKEYEWMLAGADVVVYLVTKDSVSQDKIVSYLYDRNHKMVDSVSTVIALYPDDTWTTSKGGTSECMRYAHKHKKSIQQIRYNIINSTLSFVDVFTI